MHDEEAGRQSTATTDKKNKNKLTHCPRISLRVGDEIQSLAHPRVTEIESLISVRP